VIEGATIFFVAVLGDLLGEGDVNLWGGGGQEAHSFGWWVVLGF